ncbi:MAG: hypothetical protein SOZ45_00710 [Ruminococcus sp.]|nr:hypothetical protein [Ruminococcus sp.]
MIRHNLFSESKPLLLKGLYSDCRITALESVQKMARRVTALRV